MIWILDHKLDKDKIWLHKLNIEYQLSSKS